MVSGTAPPLNPIASKQKLAAMVEQLLNRPAATGGDITQITDINVWTNGDITGRAVSKRVGNQKLLSFLINIPRNQFEYQLIDQKLDSRILIREDARKQSKCTKGVRCKKACIQAGDACRNTATSVASKAELQRMQATAIAVNPAAKDAFEGRTIRELQEEARKKGVYRANHQKKEELINTLKVLESNPRSQEQIRKTLEKRRATRKAAEKLVPKDALNIWKSISKLSGKSGGSPETAALLVAGALIGASTATVNRMRDRYKSGLNESAQSAMERALKMPVTKTNKPNVTFAVGGFSGTGSTGQRVKDLLEAPQDGTKGEKWFGKDNHIIPFNSPEFNIKTPSSSKRNPDGSYNPVYLGSVAKQGFGQFVQNFGRKRNEASVDLAASIYAHAVANPAAQINALAHGVGGNVADEATEILARMKHPDKKKGVNGAEIAKRLNIVRLGSPHFGFTNDKGWSNGLIKHRTITSSGDPFSILPKRAAQWISTVRGAEPDDYLKNGEVRDRIREAFGYYSSSLLGREAADKRGKEVRKSIGEAISVVSPNAGKLWNQLGAVQEKAKENPVAAGILGGAVVLSTSAATYQTMRKNYQAGLNDSAGKAFKLAQNEKVKKVANSNITFAVGGAGSPSQDIIDAMPDKIKGTPNGKGGYVGGQTHFVGFDDEIARTAKLPETETDGLPYNAELLRQGYGGVLTRALKGVRPPLVGKTKVQNEDAIALASQIYAQAQYQFKPIGQGGRGRKDYKINVLAGNTGGVTAREAMEILARMPNGDKIAKQVSLVTLGTPSFGLVNNDPGTREKPKFVPPETNFMGNDPVASRLPGRGAGMTRQVPVRGSDAKSFLGSTEVMAGINQTFGYKEKPKSKPKPKTTTTQTETTEKKKSQQKPKPRKDADETPVEEKPPAPNPREYFASFIKKMIESVFTDGIRSVPAFDVSEDGTMTGQFKENTPRGQLYSFVITNQGKIKYNEADALRKDSANFPYWTFRVDAAKQPSCQKGKRCGEACVEKGLECDRELPPEVKSQLPKAQKAAKAAKVGKWAAAAAILAGGAIAATAVTSKNASSNTSQPLNTTTPKNNQVIGKGAVGAATAVAAVGGAIAAKKTIETKQTLNKLESYQKELEMPPAPHFDSWKPSMTEEEADEWAKNTQYKQYTYHGTGAADPIAKGGFDLTRPTAGGRVWGDGVYTSDERHHSDAFASTIDGSIKERKEGGKTLKLKINARKVLKMNKDELSNWDKVASRSGLSEDYNKYMKILEENNKSILDAEKKGIIKKTDFNKYGYAANLKATALIKAGQKNGYDALDLNETGQPQTVIFDPRSIAVVGIEEPKKWVPAGIKNGKLTYEEATS